MTPDMAATLAMMTHDNAPMHIIMQSANSIYEANNSSTIGRPFAEVDVRFTRLLEWMKEECSQRERDIAALSSTFSSAYHAVHVDVAVFHQIVELDLIVHTMERLRRLNLEHLMTDGLNDDMLLWLKSV